MGLGKAVSILDISNPSDWRIDVEAFNSVLYHVGNRPIAIYSMNGATRSGKSFLLNYFLRHFDSQNETLDELLGSFDWRSGLERVTVGINLWSKPYFVQTDEGEVAVLLMDTQGLFDKNTTYRQNAIIFTLSCLLSSVVMFNHKGFLSEDVLQHIEHFSNFANNIVYQNNNHSEYKQSNLIGASNKLLFVLRDFELPEYEYGLHTRDQMPQQSMKNFYNDMFSTNILYGADCPEENRQVRQRIAENYPDLSAYLLPHPGNKFVRQRNNQPDAEFNEQTHHFVQMLMSEEYLTTVRKIIGGKPITGKKFKDYLLRLQTVCKNIDIHFSDVRSMQEYEDHTQCLKAVSTAIAFYENSLQQFIFKNPEGVVDVDLKTAHSAALENATDIYNRDCASCENQLKDQYLRKLEEMAKTSFVHKQEVNKTNLDERRRKKIIKGATYGGIITGVGAVVGAATYFLLTGPLGVGAAAAVVATKMSLAAVGTAGAGAAAGATTAGVAVVGTTVTAAGAAALGAGAVVMRAGGSEDAASDAKNVATTTDLQPEDTDACTRLLEEPIEKQ